MDASILLLIDLRLTFRSDMSDASDAAAPADSLCNSADDDNDDDVVMRSENGSGSDMKPAGGDDKSDMTVDGLAVESCEKSLLLESHLSSAAADDELLFWSLFFFCFACACFSLFNVFRSFTMYSSVECGTPK